MNRIRSLAAMPLALAPAAMGQSYTSDCSVAFSLRWAEHGGNGNGVIEPGESVLFALDASFTNQNAIAHFSPPITTFGSGTIRGLGSGFLDLIGSTNGGGDARGEWNVEPSQGYGVTSDWDLTGGTGNGTPEMMGEALRSLQFGQFPQPFGVNTTNPVVSIWTGVWTPASYAPRLVEFTPMAALAAGNLCGSVVLRVDSFHIVGVFVVPQNLSHPE